MTRTTIKRHATFNKLANACCKITGIYPADIGELKKAMLGHDLSLLIKYT